MSTEENAVDLVQYEIMAIIEPDCTQAQYTKHFEAIKDLIEKQGGKITGEQEWGKRELAYTIKKQDNGFYVVVTFDLDPANLQEISDQLRITAYVLRFLVIKTPENYSLQEYDWDAEEEKVTEPEPKPKRERKPAPSKKEEPKEEVAEEEPEVEEEPEEEPEEAPAEEPEAEEEAPAEEPEKEEEPKEEKKEEKKEEAEEDDESSEERLSKLDAKLEELLSDDDDLNL